MSIRLENILELKDLITHIYKEIPKGSKADNYTNVIKQLGGDLLSKLSTDSDVLTVDNSILLLVDYQKEMIDAVRSKNPNIKGDIMDSITYMSKAAQILSIPTVLTSINVKKNGVFFPEITDCFPDVDVIPRVVPVFDALQDKVILDRITLLSESGKRNNIIVGGLWTSMCVKFTCKHLVNLGYKVHCLMDATGDASEITHKMAIKAMIQYGVVPTTWMPVVTEIMHDWSNPLASKLQSAVYKPYFSKNK